MDFEKAYNEALERAKKILLDCTSEERKAVEYAFPELREDEDEKIRKAMITYLKNMKHNAELSGEDTSICDKWINYLEKQKELTAQVVPGYSGHYFYDGEKLHLLSTPATEENPYDFAMSQQEKQKPAEWSEDEKTAREIKEFILYKAGHLLDEATEHRFIAYLEKQKEQKKPNIELIQRSWYMEGYHDREFNHEPKWIIKTGEEGPRYEENPKYGQMLEKEQKPTENIPLSREEILGQLLQNGSITIFDYLYLIDKRKPAEWSDEDEKQIRQIEQIVKNWASPKLQEKIHNFLSSLRPQPKQKWSEEDESMLERIIRQYEEANNEALKQKCSFSYDAELMFLKSLRPQPHWKPSEEQMDSLHNAIIRCKGYSDTVHLPELYEDLEKL